ncbi:MAG: SpoIIE family protein phosphatase [Crocinitomicaceae bacterium]|nr:SpoIIE family protein phosphatase [Crocinitomicaceae bacterium]
MNKAFPKSFVYNRPKNIIGGDFYWLFQKGNLNFLAVADCTGHGVSGALLSIICSEALNRSVGEFKLEDPASILNKVRELVKDHLKHSNEKLYDGMDIALISLRRSDSDQGSNELCFAGANSSIIVKTVDGIQVLGGDRQPIGKYFNESSFQNFQMSLKNEDIIFLSSDGYLDQFGGPEGKKMKISPFLTFLRSIEDQSIASFESEIISHFENWKGEEEQVDDVCILGFQIN